MGVLWLSLLGAGVGVLWLSILGAGVGILWLHPKCMMEYCG